VGPGNTPFACAAPSAAQAVSPRRAGARGPNGVQASREPGTISPSVNSGPDGVHGGGETARIFPSGCEARSPKGMRSAIPQGDAKRDRPPGQRFEPILDRFAAAGRP
jgi:hypothetical protein